MANVLPSTDDVWTWLNEVPDPEIPVISVTDLGIVREILWDDDTLVVAVTPTYSGCPATAVIELAIETHLKTKGLDTIRIERRLSPAWTTDWLTPAAREKLLDYGIAPPVPGTAIDARGSARAARLAGQTNLIIPCPRCGSNETEKVSQFGSTPCKASYRCTACLEPFDYFKCL